MTPLDQAAVLVVATAVTVGAAVTAPSPRPETRSSVAPPPLRTRSGPPVDDRPGPDRAARQGRPVPGRRSGVAPSSPARVGIAAVVLVLSLVVLGPVGTAGLGAAVALAIGGGRRRRASGARRLVRDAMPELIDLFVVAASAGHPVRSCVELVAERSPAVPSQALRIAVARLRRGATLDDALVGLGRTLGPDAAPLVEALRDGAREGSPVTERLRTVAATARDARCREAEAQARRVPVRMIFPLVCCTLPAVGLLAVVPLLVASLSSLSP